MKSSYGKFENSLLMLGGIACLTAFALLYFDFQTSLEPTRSGKIGHIQELTGEVFVQLGSQSQQPSPSPATPWKTIRDGDSVTTLTNSSATVRLGEHQVFLAQQTEIQATIFDNIVRLKLLSGKVAVRSSFNSVIWWEPIGSSPVKSTALQQGEYVLSHKNATTAIDVVSGQLNVQFSETPDENVTLESTERLWKRESGAWQTEKYTFETNQEPFLFSPTGDARLQWFTPGVDKNQILSKGVFVSIGKTPLFQEAKTFSVSGMEEIQVPLEDRKYYWKVEAPGFSGQISSFVFAKTKTPQLLLPEQRRYGVPYNGLVEINAKILHDIKSKEHQVQIATDSEFQTISYDQTMESKELQVQLPPGLHHFRTRSIYSGSVTSNWTATEKIEVFQKLDRLALFKNLPKEIRIELERPEKENIADSTDQTAEISATQTQLAQTPIFKNFFSPLLSESADFEVEFAESMNRMWSQTSFPTNLIEPGVVFFRYRYKQVGYKDSPWSSVTRVIMQVAPPTKLEAELSTGTSQFLRTEAKLSWKESPFTPFFEIQLSQNPHFEEYERYISETNLASVQIYPSQKYYWRVRSLGLDYKPVGSFSRVSELRAPLEEPVRELAPRLADTEPAKRAPSSQLVSQSEVHSHFKRYWAWISSGFNYISYKQSLQQGNLAFGSVGSPSLYVEIGGKLYPSWSVRLHHMSSPGRIENTKTGNQTLSYSWSSTGLESLHRVAGGQSSHKFVVAAGIEMQTQPLLSVTTITANNREFSLLKNQIDFLSLGMEYEYRYLENLKFTWAQKMLYPILAKNKNGGSLTVSPNLSFDGSLGAEYSPWSDSWLGLYWYGQLHQYGYNLQLPNGVLSGEQNLLFSNLELRLGYEF